MRRLLASVLLLAAAGGRAPMDVPLVVLRGATVVPCTGEGPLASAAVVIRDARIAAVGAAERTPIPPGAEVVDASGLWLVPGLVDAHVHFFQSGGLYTRPDVIDLRSIRPYREEIGRIRERLPLTLTRYLACGVTGVLDTGGPLWNFQLRQLAARRELAPRVAVAGPLLSPFVPPELAADDPPIVRVRTAAEARAIVRAQLVHQPDILKLWLVDWSGRPRERSWVRAAVEESHRAGVRVAAHATSLEVARAAVEAGVDLLVHSVEDAPIDAPLLEALRRRRVVYIPTLVVTEGYERVLGGDARPSEQEARWGDPEVVATWADRERLRPESPAPHRPDRHQAVRFENLRRVHRAGIVVAAGSDAGNIGTLHGPGLHRELERMAEAGLTPGEVLVTATRGGAAAMGRTDRNGTVETGMLADLLLLEANPLEDVRNLRRIHRVVKGGRVLEPEEALRAAAR